MTRDEIIMWMGWSASAERGMPDILHRIERIVRTAEKEEREACAQIVDEYAGRTWDMLVAEKCGAAIRARGEE